MFEDLAAQTADLNTKQEAHLFISGLKQRIAIDVKIQRPQDLMTAVHLARLYEQRSGVLCNQPRRTTPLSPTTQFVKRLNRTEMEVRRAKELCFNCDEPYVQGHRCKRLFWLEISEDLEPEDDTGTEGGAKESVEASIHNITGPKSENDKGSWVHQSDTIKYPGGLRKYSLLRRHFSGNRSRTSGAEMRSTKVDSG